MDNPEIMERIERAIARIERATKELGALEERLRQVAQRMTFDYRGRGAKDPDAA